MNRQNISLLIFENISDDDNIEIVENYLANSGLEDKLLQAHKTLGWAPIARRLANLK